MTNELNELGFYASYKEQVEMDRKIATKQKELEATHTISKIKEIIEEYADCRQELDSLKCAVAIYDLMRPIELERPLHENPDGSN